MRKHIALIVAFVLLVGVAPASAQIFAGQYGPADRLIQSNLDTVERWMWYGNMYGFVRGGQFYGLYGRDGRRLSRPVKIAIVGGVIGGAIGGSRWGKKGAVIGSIAGAAPGLLAWALRDDNNDERMANLPDQIPPMPQTQTGRPRNGWDDRLREQANAGNLLFGSRRGCLEQGMVTLKNDGRNPISVYQDGVHYLDLLPRRSECGDPRASYEAEVLTMVVEGYAGTMDTARRKPEGRDGLVLVWR